MFYRFPIKKPLPVMTLNKIYNTVTFPLEILIVLLWIVVTLVTYFSVVVLFGLFLLVFFTYFLVSDFFRKLTNK